MYTLARENNLSSIKYLPWHLLQKSSVPEYSQHNHTGFEWAHGERQEEEINTDRLDRKSISRNSVSSFHWLQGDYNRDNSALRGAWWWLSKAVPAGRRNTEESNRGGVLGACTSPERLPWLCSVRTWKVLKKNQTTPPLGAWLDSLSAIIPAYLALAKNCLCKTKVTSLATSLSHVHSRIMYSSKLPKNNITGW